MPITEIRSSIRPTASAQFFDETSAYDELNAKLAELTTAGKVTETSVTSDDGLTKTTTRTIADFETFCQLDQLRGIELYIKAFDYKKTLGEEVSVPVPILSGFDTPFTMTVNFDFANDVEEEIGVLTDFLSQSILSKDNIADLSTTSKSLTVVYQFANITEYQDYINPEIELIKSQLAQTILDLGCTVTRTFSA